MTLSETPGSLKRFCRTPWRFQQTFHTPLQNLRPFVATIVSSQEKFQAGCVTLDHTVFEPKNLNALLARHSLPTGFGRDWSIEANGPQEVADLLEAALGDWLDFTFVPTPKPVVLYADHDEYTTFYANTKSNLNSVVEALATRGFQKVPNYEREF
jgi:hypothetical protein